ncbi:histidine kinase dimerization/phospho-acceptor domain-containing protein [Helicobacter sp. MIT 05-5294]|uniref:histidine kinase dimerization/phospho-acceptor domain-containing protein n=1 Tax=Helicobacter sp. MIT 05-5294 TaxID=1548150 RepID=UPI000B128B2E|nr:histidine kinase dimerization/phospho-acceptor domain-containing protein [Helicobacter sp. MIT 05-5294]
MSKFRIPNLIPPLFVQIYVLFIASVCISGVIVYFANVNNLKKNEQAILSKTTFLAQQSLLEFISGNTKHLQEMVENNHYEIVRQMPKDAVILLEDKESFTKVKIFRFQSYYGFCLEYLGMNFVAFKDYESELFLGDGLNVWIFLDFLIQLLTFSIILALLHPLKVLQNALQEFAKGNYKIKIPVPKEPQQARLAWSFNTMSAKISKLMMTREFVLRNIGHELKTPISKAKLALEMMPENPQKELVMRCVGNLDSLTSQILTFEKIQEGGDLLVWREFEVETLVLETLQHLFLEQEELEIEILENFRIRGDLQFLSIALKNLIENAKKYKSGGKITMSATQETSLENTIVLGLESQKDEVFCLNICNVGNALKQPISYYLEPFSREDTHALIQGYGLGLGIVKGILELHHLGFGYLYQPKAESQGIHCFKIIFPKE